MYVIASALGRGETERSEHMRLFTYAALFVATLTLAAIGCTASWAAMGCTFTPTDTWQLAIVDCR